MISFKIDPGDSTPLVAQVVEGIRRQIDDRLLRPGTKLPSIRKLAETYRISRFTAVESYDRLVALGYLEARRGAGFFTTSSRNVPARHSPSDDQKRNEELVWLVRRLLEAREGTILAGGPWLPNDWMDEMGIRQGLAALARKNGTHLIEYGNPRGYLPLREHIVLMLSELPLPSLKFKHFKWRGNEVVFLLIGIGLVLVLLYGVLAVPLILLLYLLSPLWGRLLPKQPA